MSKRELIISELKKILADSGIETGDSFDNINDGTHLINDLGLTSVSMIYMMISIEEVFEMSFDDDVTVTSFETVGDVADYIEEYSK